MNDRVLWSLIYKKKPTNETGISNQIILLISIYEKYELHQF